MLKNKTEGIKNRQKGRSTLIGVCLGIIGIFSLMIIRSLYVCTTRETMDCTLDTFSIPLAVVVGYSILLLITIFKYEWIANEQRDLSKNRMYLIFLIILLILMVAYYLFT